MVNVNLSHDSMKKLVAKRKQAGEEKYLEESRKRLTRIIEKKITTAFVAPVAAFETFFGPLIGLEKKEEQRTEEQQVLYDLYLAFRDQCFTKGHAQIRAAKDEISNHIVKWQRYRMDLPVKPLKEEK